MSALVPCSMPLQPNISLISSTLAIPTGDSAAVVSHMKMVLANPHLSPNDLETIVANLLAVNDEKPMRYNRFCLWSDIHHIVGEGNAPQAEPFLRILGRKYYDSYHYAVETLLKKLTTPAHMVAFLDGLRQNQDPIKGRWHADRYALIMVDILLNSKTVSASCIQALQAMREELKQAVEALPPSESPDILDFKAINLQERELKTPRNRVTWDHVLKIYKSNLGITKFSAMEDGSGNCGGSYSTDSIVLKNLILNMMRKKDLSETDVSKELKLLENRPLKSITDASTRDAEIMELLDRSFYMVCASWTDADKRIICQELEKFLLETMFQWAFESTMGTTIDDRQEGWFPKWIKDRQRGNAISLDVCPRNEWQMSKCVKVFPMNLEFSEHANLPTSTTSFVLNFRQNLIEKTMGELLQTIQTHQPY